jgi:hypothetical protein
MAYKSKFTGAKIDELLTVVQTQQDNPTSILEKLSGQDIIDKINSVEGSIIFTKFVDCQGGAGKTE